MSGIDPYRIREIVSMYVDVYYDEMTNLPLEKKPEDRTDNCLKIIQEVKTHPFQNMQDMTEFDDWFKKMLSTYPLDFSPFITRGYEFFLFHFYNFYSPEMLKSFRKIVATAMDDSRIPLNTTEFTKPNQTYLQWDTVYPTRPWALFVLILRNTYINMGDEPEPEKSPQ